MEAWRGVSGVRGGGRPVPTPISFYPPIYSGVEPCAAGITCRFAVNGRPHQAGPESKCNFCGRNIHFVCAKPFVIAGASQGGMCCPSCMSFHMQQQGPSATGSGSFVPTNVTATTLDPPSSQKKGTKAVQFGNSECMDEESGSEVKEGKQKDSQRMKRKKTESCSKKEKKKCKKESEQKTSHETCSDDDSADGTSREIDVSENNVKVKVSTKKDLDGEGRDSKSRGKGSSKKKHKKGKKNAIILEEPCAFCLDCEKSESRHSTLENQLSSECMKLHKSEVGKVKSFFCQVCQFEERGRFNHANVVWCSKHRLRLCITKPKRPSKYEGADWICPNDQMTCWERAHSFYLPRGLWNIDDSTQQPDKSLNIKTSSELSLLKRKQLNIGERGGRRRKTDDSDDPLA